MSNAEQLKALLKSHREGDELHFYSVALQMAAMEARKGNGRAAEELKQMIDAAKAKPAPVLKTVALHQPRGDLGALLVASYPASRLSDLVADARLRVQLDHKVYFEIPKLFNVFIALSEFVRGQLLFLGLSGVRCANRFTLKA